MEVLIVIIGIIISIVYNARKNAERKVTEERRKAAVAARLQAAQQKKAAAAQPATVLPPVSFADVPGQVAMPTVHAHIEPDYEVHDAPGSLGAITAEGKDPCHEEDLTMVRTLMEENTPQTGGLSFDWSGESMVKAFVMQEVLTRPVHRVLPGQRRAQ